MLLSYRGKYCTRYMQLTALTCHRRVEERSAREAKRQDSDMSRLLDDLRIGSGEGPGSSEPSMNHS